MFYCLSICIMLIKKALGICAEGLWISCAEGLWIRAGVRLWDRHPNQKVSLVNLYSGLKTRVLPLLEGNNKKQKTITHNSTLDNQIFMHIQ